MVTFIARHFVLFTLKLCLLLELALSSCFDCVVGVIEHRRPVKKLWTCQRFIYKRVLHFLGIFSLFRCYCVLSFAVQFDLGSSTDASYQLGLDLKVRLYVVPRFKAPAGNTLC